MTAVNPDDKRGAAESAEGETRAGRADVIYLPDQSQPEPPSQTKQPGKKGRHFGARRVPDPRNAWLSCRCTPAFSAKVKADAEAAGLSLTDYLHVELGGARSPRRPPKPGPDAALLRMVLAVHGRNSGNINQMAKRLNSYDFRGQPELQAMLESINAAAAAMQEAARLMVKSMNEAD